MAYDLMVDYLYQARSLLRSYCLSLAYKYPAELSSEKVCEQMDSMGGLSQLNALMTDLNTLNAKKAYALIESRSDSGAGDNDAVPYDITHKIDLAGFIETGTRAQNTHAHTHTNRHTHICIHRYTNTRTHITQQNTHSCTYTLTHMQSDTH